MSVPRLLGSAVNRLAPVILGVHPNNTLFSFNYFTVRHLRVFLTAQAASLPVTAAVFLDVGAGKSPYRSVFRGRYTRYIALDIQSCFPAARLADVEYVEGTAEDIPLPDGSVDVVLFNQVLEHVADPHRSVQEIHRVLKAGGILLGSVPHVSPVHLEPYDFRRYTDLGLRQLLENAGYSDLNVSLSGGVYSAAALLITMDWMISRRAEGQPQRFSMGRALLLSPLVGFLNALAFLADSLLPNTSRSPANLCWAAKKGLPDSK